MNKILLVGRHAIDFGGQNYEVVEAENITFPATAQECRVIVKRLLEKAQGLNAALVFQAVPGQLAMALAAMNSEGINWPVGAVINKPGERLFGVKNTVEFESAADAQKAAAAIKSVNPNTKIQVNGNVVETLVDPPMRFVFDHISWL